MRRLILTASLVALIPLYAEAAMEIKVPLEAGGWAAQPEQVRAGELPRNMRLFDGPEARVSARACGCATTSPEEATSFRIGPRDAGHALLTMVWTRPLPESDLTRSSTFVLSYCALGIARSSAALSALSVVGKGPDGKEMTVPLLPVAEVINDGGWHAVVGQVSLPASGVLRVQLGTRDNKASLVLRALRFMDSTPAAMPADLWRESTGAPSPEEARLPSPGMKWQTVDLGKQYNDTCAAAFARLLQKQKVVIDGVTALDSQPIYGIPFRTGDPQANLVHPAESKADEEPVEFLGAKMTRHLVYPPGRDDTVTVDIGRKAAEVAFLMISEVPKGGGRYAIAPGPHNFNDIGALSVELQYETGEPDVAFPYSLDDRGFTATRMAGVYMVAADSGRALKRLVLHNRVNGNNHSLGALTVNTGKRLCPELVEEPRPLRVKPLAAPRPQQPYLRREGDLLKLGNSACDMVIDCADGLRVTKFVNRRNTKDMVTGAGLGTLQVCCGEALLYGKAFRASGIAVEGTQARVTLASVVPEVPLTLDFTVAVDGQPEVRFGLSARNTGDREITPSVRLSLLDSVALGEARDTWMFFPQYRNVLSPDDASYLVGNDRSFPMQFMDVSNPVAGVGLGLLTRDTQLTPLQYGMRKEDIWVTGFVQTPEAFSELAPGQTLTLPETVLLPHAGDWHVTMEAYKRWLASVTPVQYVPADVSSASAHTRDWFQKLFAMRVHLTKKAYSWAVPIYDPATKQYKIDEFMKADTEYLGLKPEIVHFGGWCDFDHEEGGDWLGGDYAVKDYTGGPDNLRAAIRKLQDEDHIPASLYMIPDRCRKTSEIGQKLGRKACTVRADGWVGDDGPLYYTCCAYQPWVDHYVEAVKRTQAETGVKAIYVDVFGFSQATACYSTEHGHPVPSNPKQVNRELIRRIREALPPDVAVWTEFPLDDLNAQYVDGNINYYCLNWHEYFSETYDAAEGAPGVASPALNAYRYVFPHTRQWIFLCGSENWSSDCKFPFFNGEPLYDVSWFLYAGSNLALVRNALALQTNYADCFSAANPTMEVPTEKWAIHANEFPGQGRTAWTLYNARYTTVSGPVLKVRHTAGATYLDAWNGRPLKPAISGKTATIALRLGPQAVGCVVQKRQ